MNRDRQLQETLKWLAGPVDRSGVWASIIARAGIGPREIRERNAAPRHRPRRLRVAVYASIAVGLVIAVVAGSVILIGQLGRPDFVLVITDDIGTGIGDQGATSGEWSGHWELLPVTNDNGAINALVIDPSNPSVLYAETAVGIYRSTDGAESWSQTLDFSKTANEVLGVAFDPASPSTVYMVEALADDSDVHRSTHNQLLRSTDGGTTWTDLGEADPAVWSADIWFDTRSSPSTVYIFTAIGWSGAVLRSIDRGQSWTELSGEEFDRAHSLRAKEESDFQGMVSDPDTGAELAVIVGRVDPTDPSIAYAGTVVGVYKSTDGRESWRKMSSVVWEVVPDPSSPSVLYAATSQGIMKSSDGGNTWGLILTGRGSVVIAPSSPSALYAWTSAGLFRTDNGGTEWTRLPGDGLVSTSSASGSALGELVLVSADNPDIVFAMAGAMTGNESGDLLRSTNGGNTWSQVLEGAAPGVGGGLVVADPQDASTLFASTYPGRVVKSTDAGGTWTMISPEQWADPVVEIAVDPRTSSNIYVVQTTDAGSCTLSRSSDGGAAWESVGLEGLAKGITQLVFDPAIPDALYASTFNGTESVGRAGLYLSEDRGVTWRDITEELPNWGYVHIVIDPAHGGALYALTFRGLYHWVPSSG